VPSWKPVEMPKSRSHARRAARKRLDLTWRRRLSIGLAVTAAVLLGVSLADRVEPRQRSVRSSIEYWSRSSRVDVHLARAVAWMESGNDPDVVSPTGARGVMQVEPSTWTYTEHLLGTRVPHTTDGNIQIGVAYLGHMLEEFGGNRRLALAAYYEGPRAVREAGVYPSSERYVATVLALTRRM
jgi:soluble lytic murein transglycosylase-like protein